MDALKDIWPYISEVWHYFMWLVPGIFLEIEGTLSRFWPKYELLQKKIPKEIKRKIAHTVLLIGFLIANFLTFHDAMQDGRQIQKDFNDYKVKYSLTKSENEKNDERIRKKLLKYYLEIGLWIDVDLLHSDPQAFQYYNLRIMKWMSDCTSWIDQNIGSGARAKFLDTSDTSDEFIPHTVNMEQVRMANNLLKYKKNLDELIKSDGWKNYAN